MSEPMIHTDRLSKSFEDKQVLDNISLSIPAGQVVGLLGKNGSGKTTLIKLLLGLLRPDSGTTRVLGEDSWNLGAKEKSRIGYVSQDFGLLPWMKVQKLTEYTGAFYENWDPAYVKRLMEEWELNPKDQVGALSTGQRQKLAVIMAMGHHPDLLILDEPVASLDPVARRQFLQSLLEFVEEESKTILFSTHITSDVERIASHVAVIQGSSLSYCGELDVLKDRVKRIRFESNAPFPADFAIPNAIRYEVEDSLALAAVSDFRVSEMTEIADRYGATMRVEDLNLEEIFVELSREGLAAEHLQETPSC